MAFYLDSALNCTRVLMRAISGWVPRHIIGAVLVSLPTVAVFSHAACDMHLSIQVDFWLCLEIDHTGFKYWYQAIGCKVFNQPVLFKHNMNFTIKHQRNLPVELFC